MQSITAQYKIATPMFIGGANKEDSPEIRPPSIKGALRFWWRALNWGRCLKQADNNSDRALQSLYRQEAELFGAATQEQRYGQGLCLLKLKAADIRGEEKNWPENNDPGAGFLGYGLDKTRNGDPHRKAISKGTFTVELILKAAITERQIQQLKDTLLIWGLLGGLGSRNRRGFGSVAICTMDEENFEYANADDYLKVIKKLFDVRQLAPPMPPFTALNEAMQIRVAGQNRCYRTLMDRLGATYKQARKDAGKGLKKLPFGLPLAGNKGESDDKNRRSSPLLMHIHPVGKEYIAIISFIPAIFHPDYPKKGNCLDFYKPVDDYLQTMERVYP